MRAEEPIFCQVMDWIHGEQFRRCVNRYQGNYRIRNFSCWDQFLAMSFAQITYRDSLADIEVCLRSRQDQLYRLIKGVKAIGICQLTFSTRVPRA
ncbi:MAG TPA: DUF4372 domain-containing protein [Verrucomicrobiae bacterium]|jgi:hypothetical protein